MPVAWRKNQYMNRTRHLKFREKPAGAGSSGGGDVVDKRAELTVGKTVEEKVANNQGIRNYETNCPDIGCFVST